MKAIIYIISISSLIMMGFNQKIGSSESADFKRNQVQVIYTAELGVRELSGKNDGLKVERYLRYVGLEKGDPWCAAFVCWVFDQAGVGIPKTGWSPGLFPKSTVIWERGGRVEGRKGEGGTVVARANKGLPQKGDVFGIWFPDKGRIAHVGFVDSWSEKWLITVEGNTNEAGGREGDGVWRKRRLVGSVYQVSDFISR